MGVRSLEVYNTVYDITPINNNFEIFSTEQQLKTYNIDTHFAMKNVYLYKISDNEFVEASKFMVDI